MEQANAPLEAIFFRDFPNSYIPQILDEIYLKKVYAPFVDGRKDLTIVDWGANIGLSSYYFKDFAKAVYAVEPSLRHLEALQKLLFYNGIPNIKTCPYAISAASGKTKFFHNSNVTMYSLKDTVNDKGDFEEVETLTAEEHFKREGIESVDLLKMDLEGSESEVITSEGFRAVAPQIKVIVGEWHNWTSMSQQQFKLAFEDLGFAFTWYKNTEAQVFSAVKA
jgi:FkbM family methyltransferase